MRHLVLVMSEPVEGQEEAYNDWYEYTHLDEVLASVGWQSAERFELTDEQGLPCPRLFGRWGDARTLTASLVPAAAQSPPAARCGSR